MINLVRSADEWIFDCPAADGLAADERWWAIYESSFPSTEREPRSVILDSLRTSVGLAFRARLAGTTVGIASTHLLMRPAAVFLVYLAIDEPYRSGGHGGSLFDYAWLSSAVRLRERNCNPMGLIWEVDIPGAGSPFEQLKRQKRVSFFQRHGGVLLPHRYLQPPVNGTEAVPMQLMFRPAEGVALPADTTIDSFIQAIYFEKYGAVNGLPDQLLRDLLC